MIVAKIVEGDGPLDSGSISCKVLLINYLPLEKPVFGPYWDHQSPSLTMIAVLLTKQASVALEHVDVVGSKSRSLSATGRRCSPLRRAQSSKGARLRSCNQKPTQAASRFSVTELMPAF